MTAVRSGREIDELMSTLRRQGLLREGDGLFSGRHVDSTQRADVAGQQRRAGSLNMRGEVLGLNTLQRDRRSELELRDFGGQYQEILAGSEQAVKPWKELAGLERRGRRGEEGPKRRCRQDAYRVEGYEPGAERAQ